MASNDGWIGFDLDGTLAVYNPGDGVDTIGAPVPAMVHRLQWYLQAGYDCRIVTARVAVTGERNPEGIADDQLFADRQREMIGAWCLDNVGSVLPVTATKDFRMIRLYDDRAVRIQRNLGEPCCPHHAEHP